MTSRIAFLALMLAAAIALSGCGGRSVMTSGTSGENGGDVGAKPARMPLSANVELKHTERSGSGTESETEENLYIDRGKSYLIHSEDVGHICIEFSTQGLFEVKWNIKSPVDYDIFLHRHNTFLNRLAYRDFLSKLKNKIKYDIKNTSFNQGGMIYHICRGDLYEGYCKYSIQDEVKKITLYKKGISSIHENYGCPR